MARELLKKVESQTKLNGIGKQQFLDALEKSLLEILSAKGSSGFTFAQTPPTVVLMAGLQGSGKTTTTAKLAHYLKTKNKKCFYAHMRFATPSGSGAIKGFGRTGGRGSFL